MFIPPYLLFFGKWFIKLANACFIPAGFVNIINVFQRVLGCHQADIPAGVGAYELGGSAAAHGDDASELLHDDNVIEIWEYDSSKAKQYMDKEMEESAALLNLYLSLASSMGFDYKSEISKSVTYKYMKFKNNRLVEVKDSSIYDDIDRSSGSLYNSFWF